MSEIWNKVYSSDASFFGDVPSNFGLNCHEEFKKHVVRKLLELGCGRGRDTTFFAANGILFNGSYFDVLYSHMFF
ncbi:MAG: hypothetical protein WB706_10975, partial [Nitrososphaeraceae archaeon]